MTHPTGYLTLNENAATWQQVGDVTVLLDLRSSEYLGVNESGSVLWSALSSGTTRLQMIRSLADRFALSEAQAAADVDEFLRLCNEHDLISSRDAEATTSDSS